MRFNAGAHELVGAQAQQIQQDGVDLVRRTSRGRADDRVQQTPGAAGAVGEFGRERGVATGDSAVTQQRG